MPIYEFRCRACGQTFTEQRPMSDSGVAATCPDGHEDTVRLLSVAGSVGATTAPAPQQASNSGGCCGGGCCA